MDELNPESGAVLANRWLHDYKALVNPNHIASNDQLHDIIHSAFRVIGALNQRLITLLAEKVEALTQVTAIIGRNQALEAEAKQLQIERNEHLGNLVIEQTNFGNLLLENAELEETLRIVQTSLEQQIAENVELRKQLVRNINVVTGRGEHAP